MKGFCPTLIALFVALILPHSAAAGTVRWEENVSSAFVLEGTWQTFNSPVLSGGHGIAAATAGARVTLYFYGTGITWIGYRCACGGIARVFVDGTLRGTVDTYAASPQAQAEMYRLIGLSVGQHTVTIEVTGQRSAAATNAYVGVDAFDVIDAFDLSNPGTVLIQESDERITYTGDWIDVDHPAASGGSVVAARNANAEAVVRFNGTGISWIGVACSCATGSASVYLDGALVRPAAGTAWMGSLQTQYEIYRAEGLVAGDHTLRLVVTGRSNGTTPWVVIDGFMITGEGTGADGDRVPPTVEVYSPTSGAFVRGTVGFNTRASDNTGVLSARFFIDGVEVGQQPLSSTSNMTGIPWNTTDYSNGTHTLTVEATDYWGNTTLSAPATVTVDNQPPTALITAPQQNARITGNVTFAVEATDNTRVSKVSFFANDVLLAEDTSAPFSLTRDVSNVPSGRVFTLRAVAVDAAGNSTNSNTVTVTVQH